MKFVLDTNVLVAALIWGGKPYDLLKIVSNTPHELWTSPILLAELQRTLGYAKLKPYLDAKNLNFEVLYGQFRLLAHTTHDIPLKAPICRDPDDDTVLACALSAQADYIVSGDKDLLVLNAFDGIPIVTAAQMLVLIQTS